MLSDPEKRKKYDQYGKDWKHAEQFEKAKTTSQGNMQMQAGKQFSGDFGDEDFSDFFESMFGGAEERWRKHADKIPGAGL